MSKWWGFFLSCANVSHVLKVHYFLLITLTGIFLDVAAISYMLSLA